MGQRQKHSQSSDKINSDQLLIWLKFCRKNINCSIDESVEMFREVCVAAADKDIPVRAYAMHTHAHTIYSRTSQFQTLMGQCVRCS